MNVQELERLLDELLKGIQDVLQSGETLSDEFQAQLAQEISQLTQEIDRAYSEQAQVPQGQIESPPSNGSQLLWVLSGGDENAFVNYLRTYPGEDFQALLNNPGLLNQTISQLQQQFPQGSPPTGSDGIPDTQLKSSNVQGMKYNPKTGQLLMKFHGGSVYKYDQVPQNIFKLIEHGNAFAKTKGKNQYGQWWPTKNPSLGAAVNQYLKQGGYNYSRLR